MIIDEAGVALRKESVDRNLVSCMIVMHWAIVALRKESVDRNAEAVHNTTARNNVALRKESVDRNSVNAAVVRSIRMSLSARRAWIEI